MRQTELRLSKKDRQLIASFRAKGLHLAREVNRAHILAALDRGLSEAQIMDVLGVGRTVIWRTRAAYLQGGLEFALHDEARPGKPRQYDTDVEAQITALACSADTGIRTTSAFEASSWPRKLACPGGAGSGSSTR